jgi:cytochrome b561
MTDKTGFDTATRVLAGDDGASYDRGAIALHWTTAALVVLQFALGQTWDWFPRATKHLMIVTHMSFGIILTVVVITRVLWRFVLRHHAGAIATGWVRVASTTVHYLFYALLATEAVLGFLSRWEGNEAMSFFGLKIPSPFIGAGHKAADQIQDIHNWVGWTIIVLAVGHAAAALYHHFALHDRVLGRMFPPARKSEPTG